MIRKPIRRKPRTDRVPPEMAEAVIKRDGPCLAPRLGASINDCFGRTQISHVKAEARMAKRAEPEMNRLVALCDGHTEPGMRAGYIWCTAKVNIEAMRGYLKALYPA